MGPWPSTMETLDQSLPLEDTIRACHALHTEPTPYLYVRQGYGGKEEKMPTCDETGRETDSDAGSSSSSTSHRAWHAERYWNTQHAEHPSP